LDIPHVYIRWMRRREMAGGPARNLILKVVVKRGLLNRALFSRMEPSSAIVQADSVRDESFRLQPLKTYEPGSLRGSCSLDLCDDECGPAEFGLVQNFHTVRQEPEEGIGPQESSLSATLCGLTFEPSSERRKPCPVDRGGEVGLTPCGAAPCPEQLDPLPRSLPSLGGIENRHRQGRVGLQVPGVERFRIGQKVEREVRRIGEEGGVDVGPVPASNGRDRT